MDMLVECTAGARGDAEPAVIWFGRRRVEVRSVLDRWWGADRRWWKVDTAEGHYVLRQEQGSGEWTLAAVPRLDGLP